VHCTVSDAYLDQAKNVDGLTQLEREAFDDIKASFSLQIEYGIPTNDLFSVRERILNQKPSDLFLTASGGGRRLLEAPKRVFVVQNHEWLANAGLVGPSGWRGSYRYPIAAVFLHENGDMKNSWCRTTLVHETLHSVSLYSRIWDVFPNILSRHLPLVEGITESLTGYVLFKRHQDCYKEWKDDQQERCSISYRQSVRLWCSFCHIVGIAGLAEFYSSSKNNFTDPLNQLIQSIKASGFKFNYQLDEKKAFREHEFREICVKSLPGFKKTYDSLATCFDFSKVK
jgi:hypothetical protein